MTVVSSDELKLVLQSIDPYDFEYFIAELWEEQGWDTSVTTESNDYGIDIVAVREMAFREKHVIQAKKNSPDNKVSGPEIQQYAGLYRQEPDIDAVIIVTTSTLTPNAKEIAANSNVKYIDETGLLQLIDDLNAYDMPLKYSPLEIEDSEERSMPSGDSEGEKGSLNRSIGRHSEIQQSEELTRKKKLIVLFEHHLAREDPSNHWIDLKFKPEPDPPNSYQYLNGMHNIAGGSSDMEEMRDIADKLDLVISESGEYFVTFIKDSDIDSSDSEREVETCMSLLEQLWGLSLTDVKKAAEHKGKIGWN